VGSGNQDLVRLTYYVIGKTMDSSGLHDGSTRSEANTELVLVRGGGVFGQV
jgi:hypothetical protein